MAKLCEHGYFLEVAPRSCPKCRTDLDLIQREEISTLKATISRLRAELEECKRDAERYRWLRGDAPDHSGRWTQWEVRRWKAPMWTQDLRRDELDAAIDAAMKKEAGKEETK